MTVFDYLIVVLSVVLGLGLTHLLSGFVRFVQRASLVRFYWVHTAWSAITFVGIVFLWWTMWGMRALRVWTFWSFLLILMSPILLLVAAAFLVPEEGDRPTMLDLRQHYFANRKGLFGTYAALALLLVVQNTALNGGAWNSINWYLLVMLAAYLSACITARVRFHEVLTLVFSAGFLALLAKFATGLR